MTKEDVLKIIEKDLKFSGTMFLAFGIFLLLPGLFILLVMIDSSDFHGFIQLQAVLAIFTIPGVILIRIGFRKRAGKNNIIYSTYAERPDKIAWVYEKFTNINGRDLFYITICDDSGKSHEIQSNVGEYRILYNSIKAHCPKAVYGFKDEWNSIYRKNPKDFKVNVMQFEINLGLKSAK